jgi:hypothetical protein
LFLIDGVAKGSLKDNHGTAIRHREPIRFWVKVAIWSLFYMFAIAWNIGFALQERNKEITRQPAVGESQSFGSVPIPIQVAAGSRR